MAEKAIRLGGESTAAAITQAVQELYPEHKFTEAEFARKDNAAEIAVAVVFLNDVYRIRIPPKVDSLSGGTSFGPAPGFSGDWMWINYQSDANPYREVGYHGMRMMAFPKPLRYSTRAMAFAYRRCPQTWPTACITGTEEPVAVGTTTTLAAAAAATDLDATNNTFTVTLAELLGAAIGAAVTVKGVDNVEAAGTLVEDASAPTYVLAFDATEYAKLGAYTNLTTAATVKANA